MASTNLRIYLRHSGVLLTLLAGMAAGCKGSSAENVDAGRRSYCLASDATSTKTDGLGTGDAMDGGGSTGDLAAESVGSLDLNPRVDSVTPEAGDARAEDGIDSRLADVGVDAVGADGSGGSGGGGGSSGTRGLGGALAGGGTGGAAASGGSGGAATSGGSGGAAASGGSGGADASPDVRPDTAAGSDARDASAIDAVTVDVSLDSGSVDSPAGSPDVPASVATINTVAYAKKWDPLLGGMGVGADGTLWAAGKILNPFDFGSGTVTSTGAADAYLVKLDPATGLASAEFTFGTFNDSATQPKSQSADGVAVASSGNVGLIGHFDYEIDFTANNPDGTGPSGNAGEAGVDFLQGSKAALFYAVVSNASSGTYATPIRAHMVDVGTGSLWSIGSNPGQDAIAICGTTSKAVPLWNTNGVTKGVITGAPAVAGGGMDIVVAKIDASTGNVLWGRQFGGAGDQKCESVTIDSNGNVIIAGNYGGTLSFGGGTTDFPAVAATDVLRLYVAKLDGATGAAISAKTWGTAGLNDAFAVTVDSSDNIIVAGAISGNVDFGGTVGTITSPGLYDAFVAKLTSSLTPLWAKSFGDSAYDQRVYAVGTSANGDVFIGGGFMGSLAPLGLTASSNGATTTSDDAFTAQLAAADGSVVGAHAYGEPIGDQRVAAITVARAATGSLTDCTAIGGTFSVGMPLVSPPLTTSGPSSSAAFVARLAP